MSFHHALPSGPRIMVCEDEILLALDLRDHLRAIGCEVVGPFSLQRDALRALAREDIDAVILDVELADGASTRLAGQLQDRGVPFLVVSGLAPTRPPPEFANVEWLVKPADMSRVRAFCGSVRRSPRAAATPWRAQTLPAAP